MDAVAADDAVVVDDDDGGGGGVAELDDEAEAGDDVGDATSNERH